jgi:hypothetical protein
VVVDPGGSIDRVLEMTHMDEVLTVDPLLRDALAAVREEVDGAEFGVEGADGGAIEP